MRFISISIHNVFERNTFFDRAKIKLCSYKHDAISITELIMKVNSNEKKGRKKLSGYERKFVIAKKVGNNAFSYEMRKNKKIAVANKINGSIFSMEEGEEIAFCEYDETKNCDLSCEGIKNIIWDKDKRSYLFDNHNHSFYFIYSTYLMGNKWDSLVHVDQHKDSRIPPLSFDEFKSLFFEQINWGKNEYINFKKTGESLHRQQRIEGETFIEEKKIVFEGKIQQRQEKKQMETKNMMKEGFKQKARIVKQESYQDLFLEIARVMQEGAYQIKGKKKTVILEKQEMYLPSEPCEQEEYLAWIYTNFLLNVGNFIPPLLEQKIFQNYYCVDSTYQMETVSNVDLKKFVLDLDLDFFSEDMNYIPYQRRIEFVKRLIKKAELITIATSPYFISFSNCKQALKDLFDE